MSDIAERFARLVSEHLGVDRGSIRESSNFMDDLGADSLDSIELMMAAEEEFDIQITNEDAELILTVGDAIKLIERGGSLPDALYTSSPQSVTMPDEVDPMKVVLLGASDSGKTAFFTGLYAAYRDEIGFNPLSPEQLADFRAKGIDERVAMSLRVITPALDEELANNAKLIRKQPIEPWPPQTKIMYGGQISVEMQFASVIGYEDNYTRKYRREIEFLDPPGGAVSGVFHNSARIQAQLSTADAVIVFLPADKILKAVRTNDRSQLNHEFSLGAIKDIINQAHEHLLAIAPRDRLPVVFALCKFDKVHENDMKAMLDFLYDDRDGYITNISRNMPKIMICSTPISVVRPIANGGEIFHPWNIHWPFMFAVGATILRNSRVLKNTASNDFTAARELEAEANALDELWNRSKLGRIGLFFQELFSGQRPRTVASITKRADSLYKDYARTISIAEDDKELAADIWKSLFAEGKSCGVRLYEAGKLAETKV